MTENPKLSSDLSQHTLKLPLGLFQGFGIEIEYMIVDKESLNVLPITDKIFHHVTGKYVNEVERGDICWSNELALHVVELKTNGPIATLKGAHQLFQRHVRELNEVLSNFGACLMPTGMHPWMNPETDFKLWMHGDRSIYEAYNRIFNCTGHGWSNLQSSHINLPFENDEEFAKLHTAIRILLPILPALAASSPFIDGNLSSTLDTRLEVYRQNATLIPSITGKVIPEISHSKEHYEKTILGKMYSDIAPYDPDKILQEEWLNSHGAIARFDRNTIEIRVLDTQECPLADLAIATAVVSATRALIEEKWTSIDKLSNCSIDILYRIFLQCLQKGEKAIIADKAYLALLGYSKNTKPTAAMLWDHIIENVIEPGKVENSILHTLEVILARGTLATRIQKAWEHNPTPQKLKDIYGHLCICLRKGQMFL